jgi:hypothetical protein
MSSLFELLKWMMVCGTLVVIAFFVLLAMPKSELRTFLKPIVGWAMAVICAIYAISPIDIVPEAFLGPFGLIDDIGAVVMAIASARMAINAKKE